MINFLNEFIYFDGKRVPPYGIFMELKVLTVPYCNLGGMLFGDGCSKKFLVLL